MSFVYLQLLHKMMMIHWRKVHLRHLYSQLSSHELLCHKEHWWWNKPTHASIHSSMSLYVWLPRVVCVSLKVTRPFWCLLRPAPEARALFGSSQWFTCTGTSTREKSIEQKRETRELHKCHPITITIPFTSLQTEEPSSSFFTFDPAGEPPKQTKSVHIIVQNNTKV